MKCFKDSSTVGVFNKKQSIYYLENNIAALLL